MKKIVIVDGGPRKNMNTAQRNHKTPNHRALQVARGVVVSKNNAVANSSEARSMQYEV